MRRTSASLTATARCHPRPAPGRCVHPGAVNALVHDHRDPAREGRALPARAVTGREEEILELVAEGRTSQQTAGLLVIGPETEERHRADLSAELGLKDRPELTRYAIRAGLIEPRTGAGDGAPVVRLDAHRPARPWK